MRVDPVSLDAISHSHVVEACVAFALLENTGQLAFPLIDRGLGS